MEIVELLNRFQTHSQFVAVESYLEDKVKDLNITGVEGSLRALLMARLFQKRGGQMAVVLNDEEQAAYFYHDLTQLLGQENVFFYPSAYKYTGKHTGSKHADMMHEERESELDSANEILRTETLSRLESPSSSLLFVTYPEVLTEQVVQSDVLEKNTLRLNEGETVDTSFVTQALITYGFERVDFVYEPGQFSVRGSIIDIFSYSCEYPYRVDFFEDEIESIRTFDVESQLSKEKKKSITVVPNVHDSKMISESLLEFIPSSTLFAFADYQYCCDVVANRADDSFDATAFLLKLREFRLVDFGGHACLETEAKVSFQSSPQPVFHKNFDLIAENFQKYIGLGYDVCFLSDNKRQIERLDSIFKDKELTIRFTPVLKTLHEGFIDHGLKICCYTDHQVFDRYHKYSLRSEKARSGQLAITLKELNSFKPGDYVVHIDHGVARFGGLIQVDQNGKKQEVIKLFYRNNDILLVSIHSLHKISRYKSKEGEEPNINKLGTGAWQAIKEKTKRHVKDIARDLIALYAKRREEKGYAFSADSFLQTELESSFIYEDTPDQEKTTREVKQDMERPLPMDRLVCGDVGFGKTEIAIRAAFKAACDAKQVAVLVPTTVLALQHYKTFSERLKQFPCKVEYLNRSRSAKDVKRIVKELQEGSVHIIIGTQKILGKDVKFKDLGLLIIDEEQKFGVSVKEKIKQMKVNVDTLTMTATPIPRTLQFSLMGARDLSVISTPPANRYPIQTELHTFNEDVIREAIQYEMDRGGQVFFINNRVQNLQDVATMIRRLVPSARVAIGHGQMPGEDLEKIILDFLDYEYDVLLATTIVESGIDISNCNTIIVNNAQNFGLSDLHQLRGRVGRSNRRAFCYLLAPPLASLTSEARRRLQAIESFSELGSGFNIAMQDLDIRGAGNLLGAEQSGFIADLGYETYQKVLNEAVSELKIDEFADLYQEEAEKKGEQIQYVTDCQVETDMELTLPSDYVENVSERMSLYRELDNAKNEEELSGFETRLVDRFGPLPQPAVHLLQLVRLRWLALSLGFERLTLKQKRMVGYFVQVEDSPYFQTDAFGKLLNYFQTHLERCKLREVSGKRSIVFEDVEDVMEAYEILSKVDEMSA